MLALDEVCVPQGVDDEPSRVDERNDAPKPIAMRATNAMRRFGFFCLGGTEVRGVLAGVEEGAGRILQQLLVGAE